MYFLLIFIFDNLFEKKHLKGVHSNKFFGVLLRKLYFNIILVQIILNKASLNINIIKFLFFGS